MATAQFRNLRACRIFLNNPDNLIFCETRFTHCLFSLLPWTWIEQKLLSKGPVFGGRLIARITVSGFKRYRINHSTLFAHGHHHINGIGNFWNQAKQHMRKFNGIPKKTLQHVLERVRMAIWYWFTKKIYLKTSSLLSNLNLKCQGNPPYFWCDLKPGFHTVLL